jgi:hypothetical protein
MLSFFLLDPLRIGKAKLIFMVVKMGAWCIVTWERGSCLRCWIVFIACKDTVLFESYALVLFASRS